MVDKPLKVSWDEPARNQLKKIFEYIRQDSEQNAQKVKDEILAYCQVIAGTTVSLPS